MICSKYSSWFREGTDSPVKFGSALLPSAIPLPACNVEQSEPEIFNAEDISLPPEAQLRLVPEDSDFLDQNSAAL